MVTWLGHDVGPEPFGTRAKMRQISSAAPVVMYTLLKMTIRGKYDIVQRDTRVGVQLDFIPGNNNVMGRVWKMNSDIAVILTG